MDRNLSRIRTQTVRIRFFNAEKCNLVALKCILGGFFSFYAPDLL